MGDAKRDDLPTGTRVRRICLEPLQCGFYLNSNIHLDHLILSFGSYETDASYSKVKLFYGNLQPPFQLKKSSQPWEFTYRMTVTTATDQPDILLENDVTLSNNRPDAVVNCPAFHNRLVRINFEFFKMEGLGIALLPDYLVANKSSDVIFIVRDQKFHLNKAFIASHSSFFDKLLTADFAEKNENVIPLKDVSPDAFTDLLDMLMNALHRLYSKESMYAVLRLVDQFDVPLVLRRLEDQLILNPDFIPFNKGERLWMAEKYGMKLLMLRIMSSWTKGDAKSFITQEMWIDFSSARTLELFQLFG